MKRFQFRLDPLLKLRNHELDQCRMHLGRARADLESALRKTEQVRENAREGASLVSRWEKQGVTPPELAAGQAGTFDLYRLIETSEAAEVVVRDVVVQATARVIEARTRLETIETLEERALTEHRAEALRTEQEELDEVAGRRSRSTQ